MVRERKGLGASPSTGAEGSRRSPLRGSGSQATPGAATASPPPVSPNARVLPGDIVQITDAAHHWFPSLIVVSELKSFGIQGFAFMPANDGSGTGEAYIRLTSGSFEPVGGSIIIASPSLVEEREAAVAQAIEARRAATAKTGAVEDESAVAESDAPASTPGPIQ